MSKSELQNVNNNKNYTKQFFLNIFYVGQIFISKSSTMGGGIPGSRHWKRTHWQSFISTLAKINISKITIIVDLITITAYLVQVGCHDLDECSYYSNSAQYCGSNNGGCINIGNNKKLKFFKRWEILNTNRSLYISWLESGSLTVHLCSLQ